MNDNAKRIEWDAAVAVNEAWLSGDMDRYRLAVEAHAVALSKLPEAAERYDEWTRRLARQRLAEVTARRGAA